jgi:hypothetical protein
MDQTVEIRRGYFEQPVLFLIPHGKFILSPAWFLLILLIAPIFSLPVNIGSGV